MADPERTIVGNDVFPPEVLLAIAQYTHQVPTTEHPTCTPRSHRLVCRTWDGPFFEVGMSDCCVSAPDHILKRFAEARGPRSARAPLFIRTLRLALATEDRLQFWRPRRPSDDLKAAQQAENTEDALARLLSKCTGLDSLSISAVHWPYTARELLAKVAPKDLNRIRRLHLESAGGSYNWMPLLADSTPNLVSLSIKQCHITSPDSNVDKIQLPQGILSSLRCLQFEEMNFAPDALAKVLGACTSISELGLHKSGVGTPKLFFEVLETMPNLRRLTLDSIHPGPRPPFLIQLLPTLANLSHLEGLTLLGLLTGEEKRLVRTKEDLLANLPNSLRDLTVDFTRSYIQPFITRLEAEDGFLPHLRSGMLHWKTFYDVEDKVVMKREQPGREVVFRLKSNVKVGEAPDISTLPL